MNCRKTVDDVSKRAQEKTGGKPIPPVEALFRIIKEVLN